MTNTMTNKKKSFVMYTDYLEYFEMLDTEGRAEIIMSVLRYADGCEVDTDAMPIHIKVIFSVIRKRIDEDTEKYQKVCESKQRAAKLREQKKRAALVNKSTVVTDNDNEYEYDNVNENVNENDNDNVFDNESVVVDEGVVVTDAADCEKNDNTSADAETTMTTKTNKTTTTTQTKNNNFSFKAPDFKEVYEFCRLNSLEIDPEKFINYYSANGWMIGKNPMCDWESAVRIWAANEYRHKNKDKYKYNNTSSTPQPPLYSSGISSEAIERSLYQKYAGL